MQRVMRLLMIVAVLWCGVHAAVPDHAIADMGAEACARTGAGIGASGEAPDKPAPFEHVNHHHCPIAPDRPGGSVIAELVPVDGPLFARPAVALHSHSRAPPLEPPAA